MACSRSSRWSKLSDDPTNKLRRRETSEAGLLDWDGTLWEGPEQEQPAQRPWVAHGSTARSLLNSFASCVHNRYFA